MEITTELVKHLADLSRLNFSDEEIENFKNEFSRTLANIDELQSVDTTNVQNFDKIVDARNLREDEIKQGLDTKSVILNAPKSKGTSIVVPKVVDWWKVF